MSKSSKLTYEPTPLERVMNVLATLLHSERGLSAEEIHKIAGYPEDEKSFKKQFGRDQAVIRSLGIKIVAPEAPDFLYNIEAKDYYLDLDLEPAEQRALSWAATALLDSDASALSKVGANTVGEDDTSVTSRLGALDYSSTVNYFLQAIRNRARVNFKYRDEIRTLEPWRIIWSDNNSYVHGLDIDRQDARRFRLDRVKHPIQVLEPDSATCPRESMTSLDPWQFGDKAESITVGVRIEAAYRRYAQRKFPNASVETETETDGSVQLEITVSNLENFVWTILGFGTGAEVLTPPEARDAVIAALKYAQNNVLFDGKHSSDSVGKSSNLESQDSESGERSDTPGRF